VYLNSSKPIFQDFIPTPDFAREPNKATCFMDVPFIALKYIINEDNCDPDNQDMNRTEFLSQRKTPIKKVVDPFYIYQTRK
jgi:hypothetical protein